MVVQKCHRPKAVCHLTRRCYEGRFHLRPDEYTNLVLEYEMAKAASRSGQEVLAFMAMTNHIHICTRDVPGDRSIFMRDMVRETTRRLKPYHELGWPMWTQKRQRCGPTESAYGDTDLIGAATTWWELLYIWLNPVKAGLVDKVRDWPGFMLLPDDWGKTRVAHRPMAHYSALGGPDKIEYRVEPPPFLRDMPIEEARALANAWIRQLEAYYRRCRRERGEEVMGAEAVCAVSIWETPKKAFEGGPCPRFRTDTKEQLAIAAEQMRAFIESYDQQRERLQKRLPAIFPCGTVDLRQQKMVDCHGQRADDPVLMYQRVAGSDKAT